MSWADNGLAPRLCLLSDVRCMMAYDDLGGVYKVYADGIEHAEPDQTVIAFGKTFRYYACMNCGFECQGDTFTDMQKHLGKRNAYLHPFADNIASLEYDKAGN